MNKIIIKGRLVRDPELKTAGNGVELCKFTVAVDRRRQKDKEQQTDFFDCTAFGNTGVAISKYLVKGREVLVEGRMESSKSEKDGVKRTFWGLTVDTFEFCGGRLDTGASAPQPVIDSSSGMEQIQTEELPF
jgi:single-strand DNA-binding protein